jgi:H+/Cl- antiporter ClcA
MKQALLRTIVVLMLLAFAGIGIAHIFRPDYFVKRSGVRRGGELLTEWNRLGFQIAGAIFAAFAIYLLYILFRR